MLGKTLNGIEALETRRLFALDVVQANDVEDGVDYSTIGNYQLEIRRGAEFSDSDDGFTLEILDIDPAAADEVYGKQLLAIKIEV